MRENYTSGLRELADFIDAHPDFGAYKQSYYIFTYNKEKFARLARQLGTAEKTECGDYYSITRWFGPHALQLTIGREMVCERVKVGTRIVAKPDPDAIAKVPTIDVEEDIYEWKCPESILAPSGR